jgi:putative transposase
MEVTKKKEREKQGQEGKKPAIAPAIIEELMKGYQRPEDLSGPGGIMEQLTKRLYERGLREGPGAQAGSRPGAREPSQRDKQKDGCKRGWEARDRGAP